MPIRLAPEAGCAWSAIYSEQDEPDLGAIRNVGLPFWLAGGYGSHAKLQAALAAGAVGVQTGSVFALAEESGMRPKYRSAILEALRHGTDDASLVWTTMFSPTGFAFLGLVHAYGISVRSTRQCLRDRLCWWRNNPAWRQLFIACITRTAELLFFHLLHYSSEHVQPSIAGVIAI